MRKQLYSLMLLCCCLSLFSCQKAYVGDDEPEEARKESGVKLQLSIVQLGNADFEKSYQVSRSTDVTTLCNRVSVAVYQNGTRVKQMNQLANDQDFGKIQLTLPAGKYKILVLAYSGSKSATMTDVAKVSFSGGMSDTFWYCKDIDLQSDTSEDITMKRIVAMFRLSLNDAIPSNVKTLKFAYTGGSSTLNAVTGEGCVNSRQSEDFTITSDMVGKTHDFDVYTFPKPDSQTLKVTVTALDGNGNQIIQHIFDGVKIRCNMITKYTGAFFSGVGSGADASFSGRLLTNDEWVLTDSTF